jgi:hypothetical protein
VIKTPTNVVGVLLFNVFRRFNGYLKYRWMTSDFSNFKKLPILLVLQKNMLKRWGTLCQIG